MTKLFISFTLAPVKRKPLLNFLHHHHQLNWFNQPDQDHNIIRSTKNSCEPSCGFITGGDRRAAGITWTWPPPYSWHQDPLQSWHGDLKSWLVVVCQKMNTWIYKVVCFNQQISNQVTDHVLPALEAQATGWESLLEAFSWIWWSNYDSTHQVVFKARWSPCCHYCDRYAVLAPN